MLTRLTTNKTNAVWLADAHVGGDSVPKMEERAESGQSGKRPGPAGPTRPAAVKKGKTLEFERLYLAALPCASQ